MQKQKIKKKTKKKNKKKTKKKQQQRHTESMRIKPNEVHELHKIIRQPPESPYPQTADPT